MFASDTVRVPIVMPDLGLGDQAQAVSVWLVERGQSVSEGDRLVEIVAGVVTVDLPAPASGKLAETLVDEDDPVKVGQVLGYLATAGPAS